VGLGPWWKHGRRRAASQRLTFENVHGSEHKGRLFLVSFEHWQDLAKEDALQAFSSSLSRSEEKLKRGQPGRGAGISCEGIECGEKVTDMVQGVGGMLQSFAKLGSGRVLVSHFNSRG
jgi:hypothetical protein